MAETIIKTKREQLGMTQSEFAELSGVNLRSLQDYEQGRKPLSAVKSEVVYKISTALNCDMEDLIFEPVSFDGQDEMLQSRLNKYYVNFQKLFQLQQSPTINTPFDDVFRTLSVDCSELLIPIINEVFDENYENSDLVKNYQNEHLGISSDGNLKKRISDSNFVVLAKDGRKARYQIECQSTVDSTILLRIFEYASEIAIEGAQIVDNELQISYPRSALIYLRSSDKTPDDMKVVLHTPGGDIEWLVPVIKSQEFSIDEIFEKKLYMLIPYYILVYEKQLSAINKDSNRTQHLKDEYADICERMRKSVNDGEMSEYEHVTIRSLSQRVFDYVLQKYGNIKKEVYFVMGGQVLDYEAKDILNKGKREGRAEGRSEERICSIASILMRGTEEQARVLLEATDEEIIEAKKTIK